MRENWDQEKFIRSGSLHYIWSKWMRNIMSVKLHSNFVLKQHLCAQHEWGLLTESWSHILSTSCQCSGNPAILKVSLQTGLMPRLEQAVRQKEDSSQWLTFRTTQTSSTAKCDLFLPQFGLQKTIWPTENTHAVNFHLLFSWTQQLIW